MNRPAPAARAGKWISRLAGTTVADLAGIAGAISCSHMRQLAATHGDAGWHAHAFPLSVDGVEIVASLVLLADRRDGRRSGWLRWAALATGTTASLAANIAAAVASTVSRIIAGWPAASWSTRPPRRFPFPPPLAPGTGPGNGSRTARGTGTGIRLVRARRACVPFRLLVPASPSLPTSGTPGFQAGTACQTRPRC